jgi:hypothetical protein
LGHLGQEGDEIMAAKAKLPDQVIEVDASIDGDGGNAQVGEIEKLW